MRRGWESKGIGSFCGIPSGIDTEIKWQRRWAASTLPCDSKISFPFLPLPLFLFLSSSSPLPLSLCSFLIRSLSPISLSGIQQPSPPQRTIREYDCVYFDVNNILYQITAGNGRRKRKRRSCRREIWQGRPMRRCISSACITFWTKFRRLSFPRRRSCWPSTAQVLHPP